MTKLLPSRIGLSAYLVGLALVGYWPTPVDKPIQGTLARVLGCLHTFGIPKWFNYQFIEASANIAIFVPFGFLVSLAMPSRALWWLASIGLAVSACMELGQLLFITDRVFSPVDLVTNILGTVIGVAIARWLVPSASSRAVET